MKIEALPEDLTGGPGLAPRPIRTWSEIYCALDERIVNGFGGVSEYGITVRWDKNFLTLIHVTLSRRERFRIHGGVRFGGTLGLDDAWAHGFDHVAIAAGAGRPAIIGMKNNLIRGVRKASDFLSAPSRAGGDSGDRVRAHGVPSGAATPRHRGLHAPGGLPGGRKVLRTMSQEGKIEP
jgi:hypothetical protein